MSDTACTARDATRWQDLRRWHPEDLDALLHHADDPQVAARASDRFPSPYTRADGEAFLAGRMVDFALPMLAIEMDGQPWGRIGIRPGSGERAHSAELD